ncbi:hypothetical protein, partial [Streptomyces narbonensis]|uniref:hypothetical protein n=1 Tax=Streptomyces narbonensis TaxID=67333 RepID=UPI003F85FBF2
IKSFHALKKYGRVNLLVSGGVSANKNLRNKLKKQLKKYINKLKIYFPNKKLCTDNAAMIAYLGALRINSGEKVYKNIKIFPKWSLEKLKYPLYN